MKRVAKSSRIWRGEQNAPKRWAFCNQLYTKRLRKN